MLRQMVGLPTHVVDDQLGCGYWGMGCAPCIIIILLLLLLYTYIHTYIYTYICMYRWPLDSCSLHLPPPHDTQQHHVPTIAKMARSRRRDTGQSAVGNRTQGAERRHAALDRSQQGKIFVSKLPGHLHMVSRSTIAEGFRLTHSHNC